LELNSVISYMVKQEMGNIVDVSLKM